MVITMGSSCFGSIALKFSYVNVMDDILLCIRVVTEFTACTLLKCLFLTEFEDPPFANPLIIVLITPWVRVS